MNDILLIGGGGHCRSVIDVIELGNKYKIAGIIDKPETLGHKVLGYEVLGTDADLPQLSKKYKYAFITVGQIRTSELRQRLFLLAKQAGFELPSIVSPRAYVSKYATIDEGTIVMHDAMINAGVKIGKNCIVNSKALIEHDSCVEANCHISTGAIINGTVHVKKNSFIGSHATTRESLVIEEGSFVKAGSVVK